LVGVVAHKRSIRFRQGKNLGYFVCRNAHAVKYRHTHSYCQAMFAFPGLLSVGSVPRAPGSLSEVFEGFPLVQESGSAGAAFSCCLRRLFLVQRCHGFVDQEWAGGDGE
jgi:hypothetical protein